MYEMRKLVTSGAVILIGLGLVYASSGLKLGAVNVLSRNVTRWKNVTKDVSIDRYSLTYCSGHQCRKKSGTITETQRFIIASVETELYCRPGFYESGESCKNDCKETEEALGACAETSYRCCQNGGRCLNNNDGMICNCTDGWTGDYCTERCPENVYGPRCTLECPACSNGGICDPFTGECDCSPGWTGLTCDEKCSSGRYGKDCALNCHRCISGDGQCHHVTGECQCPVAWGDRFCSETCNDGANVQCGWFPNCCHNGATCDHTQEHSRCSCPPGYEGKYCEARCKDSWGDGCHRTCLCANGSCHPATGECRCNPGWIGKYCKQPLNETTDLLSCPITCNYGCDKDGRCKCPTNLAWNETTVSCERLPDNTQTSPIAPIHTNSIHANLSEGKFEETVDHEQSSEEESLSKVSISLITVCGALSVFVVVALVCSVKNKTSELKPWIISTEDNERRESRSGRMLPSAPPPPKIQDNAYLHNARFKTGIRDDVGEGNIRPVRQPENEDVYSVVNDDLKAARRPLPAVVERAQYPPYLTDVGVPVEEASLLREGSMRSRIGSTPSYRIAGGFQRQNSNVSTYEGSIRPISRSTSVVSRTESFYEDMNKTSRSASLCRPNDIVAYTVIDHDHRPH